MFGWFEVLIVLGVLIFLFGVRGIPELARSIGESVHAFKTGLNTKTDDEEPDVFDDDF